MSKPPEGLGKRLLRSAAQFSAGQIVSMFASIARVAVTARFLTTDANGIWLGLQLVLGYASYLHFGSLFGVFRSVPLLKAQGKLAEADRERSTSFTFTAAMSLLSMLPLFVVTVRVAPTAGKLIIGATVVLGALTLIRSYYNTIFKAESRFAELASALAWGGVISLAGVAAIPRFGLPGVLASAMAQAAVEIVLLARKSVRPKLLISRGVLIQQIRVGFLTLVSSLGVLLLTTIDRTVMIHRLGTTAAGAYYIGANIMLLMPVIAGLPAAVLTPQFFERVGRKESVLPLVERPVQLASLVFAALVGIGATALPPVIAIAWPRLVGGTVAAQAALFATYPLVLAGLVTNVFYAHDRQGLNVVLTFACAAVGFGFANLGVSITHDISGAALGAALGLYVYFPAVAVGALYVLGDAKAGVRIALKTILPIVYACVVTVATRVLLDRLGLVSQWAQLIAGVGVSSLALAPLALRTRMILRRGLTLQS